MPCPIHVWVPLTAAAVPFVRIARHKVQELRYRATGGGPAVEPARELRRWAPVAETAVRQTSDVETTR
jgi:hypothetical protein